MNGDRTCPIIVRYRIFERKKKKEKVLSDDTDFSRLFSARIQPSFGTSWFRYLTRSFADRWNILADDWRHCHGRGERTAFVGCARLAHRQSYFSFGSPRDDEEEPIIVVKLFKSIVAGYPTHALSPSLSIGFWIASFRECLPRICRDSSEFERSLRSLVTC